MGYRLERRRVMMRLESGGALTTGSSAIWPSGDDQSAAQYHDFKIRRGTGMLVDLPSDESRAALHRNRQAGSHLPWRSVDFAFLPIDARDNRQKLSMASANCPGVT
jgi:hypothetical protein